MLVRSHVPIVWSAVIFVPLLLPSAILPRVIAELWPDIVRLIHYEDMVADPAAALRIASDLCGIPMQHSPLPELGDDRGCAAPYRALMAAELAKPYDAQLSRIKRRHCWS